MRNNIYNFRQCKFFKSALAILVIFFICCDIAAVEQGFSWYAVVRMQGRKKLYTKGDIFFSDLDITECLRIEEIRKDELILKDVASKETFTLIAGERIPLQGSDMIFEKTVENTVIEKKGPRIN